MMVGRAAALADAKMDQVTQRLTTLLHVSAHAYQICETQMDVIQCFGGPGRVEFFFRMNGLAEVETLLAPGDSQQLSRGSVSRS